MKCTICHNEIADNSNFCPHCGEKVIKKPEDTTTLCPTCHKPTNKNYQYCVHCGNNIQKVAKPTAQIKTVSVLPPGYAPISAWGYAGYQLLFSIPIIGFIFLIVFACAHDNINVRSFARSYFCILLIALIIFIFFGIGCGLFY